VWVVELGALADPGAIPAVVSTVLEVLTQPGQSVIDRIVEFLANRRAMLLIDNCEHLLDGASELVATLLGASPRLVVLATSRAPLSIAGEDVLAVSPLSAISDGVSDGVRLFVDRVREERPKIRTHQSELGGR
jgi:predicted ATPase